MDFTKLTSLLSRYQNALATKKDITDAITQYRGLSFRSDRYVFNDGTQKELVNLNGTIPVTYKNNTYHFPICIWLMDTHPYNAPICFVKPTADMHIKVSMYVDATGRIYLPYLHDWSPSSSDLLGLIQVMIVVFGDHPPVYSKPKGDRSQPPKNSPAQVQPPPNPSPYGGYPMSSNFPPYPAYPQYPPTSTSASAQPPYPTGGFGMPSPYPNASPMPPQQTNSESTGTITEEHIKASLISAIQDKMRFRIEEKVNQCQAEIETLKRTKQELSDGRSKLSELIGKLERDEGELRRSIKMLEEKEAEVTKSLETLEESDQIDVDEAVTTTAPLYKQLINAYAEEAAIEDSIYYLSEGLRKGCIDLEIFLRKVRELSRKQFMCRALMQKCRQKAGLSS